MPEGRYPTLEEFWRRLEVRRVEPDLRDALAARTRQEERLAGRVGDPRTVEAVAARIVPGPLARAVAAFLDERFDQQLGRGDETVGLMPRAELVPAGFAVLDRAAREEHGQAFADVPPQAQDDLLSRAERGELEGPEGFDARRWFRRVRSLMLLGFGSDPRGMVLMGFPGPSYQPGHIWLDEDEVKARARRRPGYLEL